MRGWHVGAVAAIAAAFCWLASSASTLAILNWDQAAYIAGIASGTSGWSTAPWNAHFAIGQIYWLGVQLAGVLGATVVDGFRATNALFFGATAGILFSVGRRLSGSALLGTALTAAWATHWVNVVLVITVEDNVLYLPFVAGLIWLVATRSDAWTRRDSVRAGALAAGAALVSWQALYYLGMAFWAAIWAAPVRLRGARARLREGATVIAAFAATLLAWCVFVGLGSRLSPLGLTRSLFSRPTGSFTFRPPWRVVQVLDALGIGVAWMWHHAFFDPAPPSLPMSLPLAGALFLAVILIVFAVATRVSLRSGQSAPHVLAAALALFTALTPLYIDAPFRYLIRYDYLPLLLVPLCAWAWARWPRPAATALAALVVLQLALAWRWDRAFLAKKPHLEAYVGALPNDAQYGRDGRSWYAYFRGIRLARPDACRYVFRLEELRFGDWQFDVDAALWSELPRHLVVGDPEAVVRWRFPPSIAAQPSAAALAAEPCAWLSPDAARLFGR